jgi:hypothetical protein
MTSSVILKGAPASSGTPPGYVKRSTVALSKGFLPWVCSSPPLGHPDHRHVVLFGSGWISDLMGDFAKGITSFAEGPCRSNTPPSAQAPQLVDFSPRLRS